MCGETEKQLLSQVTENVNSGNDHNVAARVIHWFLRREGVYIRAAATNPLVQWLVQCLERDHLLGLVVLVLAALSRSVHLHCSLQMWTKGKLAIFATCWLVCEGQKGLTANNLWWGDPVALLCCGGGALCCQGLDPLIPLESLYHIMKKGEWSLTGRVPTYKGYEVSPGG